jgi:predicted permease
MPGRMRSFIRAFVRRSRFEREMSDEFQFHMAAFAADLERAGVSPEEAARRARAAFGGPDGVREECREARGLRTLDWLWQDIRYSLRLMRRSPAFTAAAVVSLGLGVGANTAIFSLVDAVLLRTLAVTRPDELYFLAHGEGDTPSTGSNYPLLERYRSAAVFSGVTAFQRAVFRVDAAADRSIELVPGQFVSGNYHTVAGAPFIHGRGFLSEPDRPVGGEGIAVISEGYWARRFARAPDVLGRTLTVDGRLMTIVGVTAARFSGFVPGAPIDITLPLSQHVLNNPTFLTTQDGFTTMQILARLHGGASAAQAAAVADTLFQRFLDEPSLRWTRIHAADEFSRARLMPAGRGSHELREQYREPLMALMGLAMLVLIIASANLANLMLARAAARTGEVAMRLCVGAGRGRLVRQFLTESVVLALMGGAFGLLVASWGSAVIVKTLSSWQEPLVLDVALNLRGLAFASVGAMASGLAFGVAPALRASTVDLVPILKSGQSGASPGGLSIANRGLIVLQVALCVVVVAVAALLAQSVHNLKTRPAGFDPMRVLLFDLEAGYPPRPAVEYRALLGQIIERIRGLPGVVAVSASTMTPVNGDGSSFRGLAPVDMGEAPEARGVFANEITPQYFQTLGIRIVRGRGFDARDMAMGRRLAILNERTVRDIFKAADPIGRTIAWLSAPGHAFEIIGVVEDTRVETLRGDVPRMVYTPMSDAWPRVQVAIKLRSDPLTVIRGARDLVPAVSRDFVVDRVRTMDEQINASLVRERAVAWLSTAFAVLASILACVGLYGVLSFHVARRTREIGIRLALGDPPHSVVARILRHAALLSLSGILVGIAGTLLATRLISTFMFGLSARDPLTIAAVSIAVACTGLGAGYLPARRAARIDPLRAIRAE